MPRPPLLPLDRADVHATPGGTLRIWRPRSGLFVTQVAGVLTDEGARAMDVGVRRIASEGCRFVACHDWEEMTDYSFSARLLLTRSATDTMRFIDAIHILMRSRVVALGVRAANVVLGGRITMHAERGPFEVALQDEMRRRLSA